MLQLIVVISAAGSAWRRASALSDVSSASAVCDVTSAARDVASAVHDVSDSSGSTSGSYCVRSADRRSSASETRANESLVQRICLLYRT